jgi:hypothetical protein
MDERRGWTQLGAATSVVSTLKPNAIQGDSNTRDCYLIPMPFALVIRLYVYLGCWSALQDGCPIPRERPHNPLRHWMTSPHRPLNSCGNRLPKGPITTLLPTLKRVCPVPVSPVGRISKGMHHVSGPRWPRPGCGRANIDVMLRRSGPRGPRPACRRASLDTITPPL